MLNAIDDTKNKDGIRLFTPAHFDLIIIDESHRSIFKKYRAIFEYFDAIMVGLTSTPKTDVDRNTYDFFEMEHGVPTYAYDYETAVYQDHVLVPYYNYEVKTKFLDEGITYDDLFDKDKERYEDDFVEDGQMPEFIPSAAIGLERQSSLHRIKSMRSLFWNASTSYIPIFIRKRRGYLHRG
ncbi:DEAD/DEAH box helicase family protein [Clostridium sp. AF22-10]|uniref:DEAD/DEAH box helicase family protein n=2 Tax=Clostridium TaxID=1485 RepID=UPI0026CF15F8